jgi:hypothetical protein
MSGNPNKAPVRRTRGEPAPSLKKRLAEVKAAEERHATGERWVTLTEAAELVGCSVAALRKWYRSEEIPSRMVRGVHGPQREVPLEAVQARYRSATETSTDPYPFLRGSARSGEITISREAWRDLVSEKRKLVTDLQRALERAVRAEEELVALRHRLEELR